MTAIAIRADSVTDRLARGLQSVLFGTTCAVAGCAAIAGLYVVKSALGINLMPGPSPLHDLLYPLISGH